MRSDYMQEAHSGKHSLGWDHGRTAENAPQEISLSISTREFHQSILCAPLWMWTSSVGPWKMKFYSQCLRCCASVGQRFDTVFFIRLGLRAIPKEKARPCLTSSVSTVMILQLHGLFFTWKWLRFFGSTLRRSLTCLSFLKKSHQLHPAIGAVV